jgi:cobalt-zinc-cadmium resistance protein CzcA
MIQGLIDFALQKKVLVLACGAALLIWGIISFRSLPVEAYPDVANNWVQIITQWPGRAGEEIEQQVTIPIEVQMNGIAHLTNLRSVSVFGLSVVTLIFDDESDNLMNRQQALERLSQVTLPPSVNPQLGPDYSPVGQIYFYTLTSTNPEYDLMQLKSLEDWFLEKQLKSVANIADVVSFGGLTREYQVLVDPNKLIAYGLSIGQVSQAIAANNVNAGGSFIEQGQQAINIRAVGLMTNTSDIGATVLKVQNGTPVHVRDIATIEQGSRIRLGQIGKAIHHEQGRVVDRDDIVEGIVLLRKGADPDPALAALHQKIQELNDHLLPPGVRITPYLDRTDLVQLTTHTVLRNLTEGILLVIAVLFLFLGNVQGSLIVAITIPFSLLFASILLDVRHIPANLLSLGALDFGMVVHGAVVMVENILRFLGLPNPTCQSTEQRIRQAAHEVQRPVFYSVAIIITAYVPIFTLQRVEGRLFRPMAWTVAFALLGSLLFAMLLAPVVSSFVYRNGAHEWRNPVLGWLTERYRNALRAAATHRLVTVGVWLLLLGVSVSLALSGAIGSEFLPHLDEGAIWARGTLAPSTGPSEGERVLKQARLAFAAFPEVTQVVSQVGRPDDGTDTAGFFNTEYFVDLKPHQEWRPQFRTKDDLIAAMDEEVEKLPGVLWNFSQPIADNMEEAMSGVKGELAIKVFGTDLRELERLADAIVSVLRHVRGVQDLGVFRVIGQPNLNLVVDRGKADRFGINVADIQDAIETAAGGKPVSQILDGEQRYDVVVRYQQPYRRTIEDIENIRVLAPSGERVSIGQVCGVRLADGAAMIYRESNSRYIAIKYSVRGYDLGSTVAEAMTSVSKAVTLPTGYHIDWAGEFESQQRSQRRLALIVPITIVAIMFILYSAFDSLKWAILILLNVAIAPIGGLVALYVTGTHFNVSSGIGFLALFGVSVQVGVILIEYINQLRAAGHPLMEAVVEGAVARLRPIMMTMLVAALGLVPAALSHGIGSDSQRPFAIVIVGGLIAALPLAIFLLPTLYVSFAGPTDFAPAPPGGPRANDTTTRI